MSLSVCLLTRNEEEHIAAALRSVAGVADEVLVADTGSRDRTAQIAAEMGWNDREQQKVKDELRRLLGHLQDTERSFGPA